MTIDQTGLSGTAWANKTYSEVQSTAAKDGSILVVPVGSVEQHGHHLPVVTDTVLVNAVANLGAERVNKEVPILVTPPIWPGYSPHHLSFGGTISLKHETLLTILKDVAASALENGFDALLLLNGHGGNASLLDSAVKTIGRAHPESEVLGLTYFNLAPPFIDEIRESELGGMSHGGEFETSLMLHLRPDLVREDDMAATPREGTYEHEGQDLMSGGPLSVYRPFNEYSTSGAIGDPELATKEKGEQIYELLGDEMETLLRDIHRENR